MNWRIIIAALLLYGMVQVLQESTDQPDLVVACFALVIALVIVFFMSKNGFPPLEIGVLALPLLLLSILMGLRFLGILSLSDGVNWLIVIGVGLASQILVAFLDELKSQDFE